MRKNHVRQDKLRGDHSLEMLLGIWIFRGALVLLMVVGVRKFSVLPLHLMSNDYLFPLSLYTFLLIVLQMVYHACDVGHARVSELVMSQILADVISAGTLYLGVALYVHRLFNPLMLLAVVIAQSLLGIGWSIMRNARYFRHHRRPRTTVVCGKDTDYELLSQSPYFFEKHDVIKVIHYSDTDVQTICSQLEGCEVVFAINIPGDVYDIIAEMCLKMGVKGYFAPRLGHVILAGARYRANFIMPLLMVERAGNHSEYRFFKRMFDMVFAVIGLIVFSPVMAATAIAIKLEDQGPVFYTQARLTKDGREFSILKFRSMTVNAEKDGVARLAGRNDSRITKVGRFIRACRIDELPQMINIIKGDMSLVGPRPERPEIARKYEETLPEFALRLQVKAGLTGLAQVYGRYNTEPEHKLQMDLMYINEMSFLKDLQLILATIKILFVKDSTQGVAQGQDTALANRSKSA